MSPLLGITSAIRSTASLGLGWRHWLPTGAVLLALPVCELATVGSVYPVLLYLEGGEAAITGSGSRVGMLVHGLERIGLPAGLASLLLVLIGMIVLRAVVEYFVILRAQQLSSDVQVKLRAEGVSAFVTAEMPFHLNRQRAVIYNALFGETKRVGIVVSSLAHLCAGSVQAILYTAFILSVAPQVAIIGTPLAILGFMAFRPIVARGSKVGREATNASNAISIRLLSTLQAIRIVKLRTGETEVIRELNGLSLRLAENFLAMARLNARLGATAQPVILISVLTVVCLAKVYLGLSLAELGLIAFAGLRLVPAVNQINSSWISIVANRAAVDSYTRLVEGARVWKPLLSGTAVAPRLKHSIAFENVHFAHRSAGGDVPALLGINLEIRRGTLLALVGRSGAGKSTMVDIMARFYDPDIGRILYDGRDIRDIALPSYRRRIEVVSQETVLFDDTIRANVNYGLVPPLDDAGVRAALKQAYCLEFVDGLAEGLDSRIGESGARLSGGQRQRLALARALAADPDILILDEPTSALDAESEAAIQRSLAELHGRTTIVVVAHRLSTIRRADTIVVIEKGRVADVGQHEDLLSRDGHYRQLFETQSNL
jgi:subfamily B ATP-binding cassette protein MsbA